MRFKFNIATYLMIGLFFFPMSVMALASPDLRKEDSDFARSKWFGGVEVLYGSLAAKRANPFFCKIVGDKSVSDDYKKATLFCDDYLGAIVKIPCPRGEQCPMDIKTGKAYRLIRKEDF